MQPSCIHAQNNMSINIALNPQSPHSTYRNLSVVEASRLCINVYRENETLQSPARIVAADYCEHMINYIKTMILYSGSKSKKMGIVSSL